MTAMTEKEMLRDIERAEAEVFAAGQLARRLVKDHDFPTNKMRINRRYMPDGMYQMELDIWARDGQALRDWAQALDAEVTAKVGPSDLADEQVSLRVEATVGSVPVHVWLISLDAGEIARYRAEGGERP